MPETKYMKQHDVFAGPSGESIERIFVKGYQRDEIRFSWWPNGKFIPRALDVTEEELLHILIGAIKKNTIFSKSFLKKLQSALNNHLSGGGP